MAVDLEDMRHRLEDLVARITALGITTEETALVELGVVMLNRLELLTAENKTLAQHVLALDAECDLNR